MHDLIMEFSYMAEKQKPMNGGHKLQRAIMLHRELWSYCSVVGGVSEVGYPVAVSPFRRAVLEKEGGKPCARGNAEWRRTRVWTLTLVKCLVRTQDARQPFCPSPYCRLKIIVPP